jgi:midasin
VLGKDGRFTFKRYMDDFPFEYYLIVRDVAELSSILADVLRQYFEQK